MSPEQSAHVELCRAQMAYAHARMVATFSAVPEDRIRWSPTHSAKSALQIVSHCVDANRQVALALRGKKAPVGPDWNFVLANKEEALGELSRSVAEFDSALAEMTSELFETTTETPAGHEPMAAIMHFMGWHLAEHAGQIDFLQTCWDDQESHYPSE